MGKYISKYIPANQCPAFCMRKISVVAGLTEAVDLKYSAECIQKVSNNGTWVTSSNVVPVSMRLTVGTLFQSLDL